MFAATLRSTAEHCKAPDVTVDVWLSELLCIVPARAATSGVRTPSRGPTAKNELRWTKIELALHSRTGALERVDIVGEQNDFVVLALVLLDQELAGAELLGVRDIPNDRDRPGR